MKIPTSRRGSRGFTLVELLVVIAIIAVLAGAGFAAGNAAIQKAKRTTALSTIVAIESAVNNFYTEYGSMPRENMTADATIDSKDTVLLNVLLGTESGTTPLNPRKVKFLSVKEGKRSGTGNSGTGGLIYSTNGNTVQGLFDPWGGPYYIRLDGDYDERIAAKTAKDSGDSNLNGRRCAVWTNGADGVSGSSGAATDDVRSWNK